MWREVLRSAFRGILVESVSHFEEVAEAAEMGFNGNLVGAEEFEDLVAEGVFKVVNGVVFGARIGEVGERVEVEAGGARLRRVGRLGGF